MTSSDELPMPTTSWRAILVEGLASPLGYIAIVFAGFGLFFGGYRVSMLLQSAGAPTPLVEAVAIVSLAALATSGLSAVLLVAILFRSSTGL